MIVNVAQVLHQNRVATELGQPDMEQFLCVLELFGTRHAITGLLGIPILRQLRHLPIGNTLPHQSNTFQFQTNPDVVIFRQLKYVELEDVTAVLGADGKVAFHRQALQRFPNRCPAHPEVLSQLGFSNPAARIKLQIHDALTQSLVDAASGSFPE